MNFHTRSQRWAFRALFGALVTLFAPDGSHAQVNFISSDIPILNINTDTNEIMDEFRIVADFGIVNNGRGRRNFINDSRTDYDGLINIEIRGSTSQIFPKKSYGLETQNQEGENVNVSLLGLPPENDWVLYAPYSDKSLMRNILAYTLSGNLGHYAPRTRLCELVVNDDYLGVYVLIEKIKRDKNRVDIAKLKPDEITGDDLTGGYIIKIDKSTGDFDSYWYTEPGGIGFQYEYPKADEIVKEQKDYIREYIQSFEQALRSDDFADPVVGYRKYIDVNSFVDYFIINELSKNIDGYFLSTFFYKDKESKGGRLTMGPVWDYNLSFGNADYRNGYAVDSFQVNTNPSPWWWGRLLQDPAFLADIQSRWCGVRKHQFENIKIIGIIDSLARILDESQQRNFQRWDILGQHVWPNYYVEDTYEEEVETLKGWTLGRLRWLDLAFSCPEPPCLTSDCKTQEFRAYPNPFASRLSVDFELKHPAFVSFTLFNMSGAVVEEVVPETSYPIGNHEVQWSAPGLSGAAYVLVMQVDGQVASTKTILKGE